MTSPIQAWTLAARARTTDTFLPQSDSVAGCNCAQLGHAGVAHTDQGQRDPGGGDFVNLYRTTLHVLPIFPLSILLVYLIAWICWQFDRRAAGQDATGGVPAESVQSDEL